MMSLIGWANVMFAGSADGPQPFGLDGVRAEDVGPETRIEMCADVHLHAGKLLLILPDKE